MNSLEGAESVLAANGMQSPHKGEWWQKNKKILCIMHNFISDVFSTVLKIKKVLLNKLQCSKILTGPLC